SRVSALCLHDALPISLSVARALGAGARRRLEVINEPSHDATFHETSGSRGDTFVVHGTGGSTTGAQRIVGEREAGVEHLLADARSEEHTSELQSLRHL